MVLLMIWEYDDAYMRKCSAWLIKDYDTQQLTILEVKSQIEARQVNHNHKYIVSMEIPPTRYGFPKPVCYCQICNKLSIHQKLCSSLKFLKT